MKKILIFLLSIGTFCALGQQVNSSAGGHYSDGNYSIDFTIGEPIIETLQSDGKLVTQGYHQPLLSIIEVKQASQDFYAALFPNPATSFLNIELEDYEGITFKLQDVGGTTLQQNSFQQELTSINVSKLVRGIYLLELIDEDNQKLKSYKFVKH